MAQGIDTIASIHCIHQTLDRNFIGEVIFSTKNPLFHLCTPFVKEAAALGLRAMIALDNGEEALAMTLADEALSLQPKQFDALVVRASMANYQQRYDE